jgi:glycosyltransferase involved in cell wall biosynthesis
METSHKKVLFLITKATWGGAQRYVYDLATHLPKDRFDVAVAHGTSGLLALKLKEAGIPTHPIQSLGRDVSPLDDVVSFWKIYKGLRKGRPDVVHLNSSKAAALGAVAARLTGVRNIIFTVHGWPFGERRNLLSKALIWMISWVTTLLSHRVICVSDYDFRIAQHMPFIGRKAIRIYNGIEPLSLSSADVIRQSFPNGVRITGTIGELNANKNQIALIEEARKKPDMYVAIVGDGENRVSLRNKIDEYGLEKRVKLFGFMAAESVLKGFDVFSLPSLKEGLPYVLLEAKAAGLPIVANRVGGVGEILDKDVSEFSLERMLKDTIALY